MENLPLSFNHFLRERGVHSDVRSLLYHIARGVKYINFSIRAGNTGKISSANSSGEQQMALDVMADQLIMDELQKSELCSVIVSEEQETCVKFDAPRGNFMVAYDPLDGSSLVSANLAIGSIFGVWEDPEVMGRATGEGMQAACFAVYGPRITLVISIKDKGTHEFELNDVGEFILTKADIKVAPETKYFAPGNLRACAEDPKYSAVMQDWLAKQRKLRYSGGMVPDLNHILCKGQGIFSYPADTEHTSGKLRLLFECGPMAFVFEEAGGTALDQSGQRILETVVTDYHQRTPIFIGSKGEVQRVVDMMQ